MAGNDQAVDTGRATILLVDDCPADLDALGELLQAHYDVLAAPSGERALKIAAGRPPPDLMLLDVLMPDMDGYGVLARMRDDPAMRAIPVMFVTALDSVQDEERGLEFGAVDYITKPFRPPIVLARVRAQLELKHARDRLANQNAYLETELARRSKENQRFEMQLLQSEKLAAIGLLAAGVAHEINNPISFVTSNLLTLDSYARDIVELLDVYAALEASCAADGVRLSKLRELKRQKGFDFLRDDIGKLISESQEGLVRVTRIVNGLKNFSRAESNDWQWTNLHDGLDSILNIIWNEIKYHCTLHKDYGDIPEIYCNPTQIDQVFLNLLVNAAQAIPGNGEIAIRSGRVGEQVFVTIADTGTGVAEENLHRLFEPFFTTKPVGKGTGLGLSIAYGIVQKHQGRIEVESAVGKGTAFTVWLPIGSAAGTASV